MMKLVVVGIAKTAGPEITAEVGRAARIVAEIYGATLAATDRGWTVTPDGPRDARLIAAQIRRRIAGFEGWAWTGVRRG